MIKEHQKILNNIMPNCQIVSIFKDGMSNYTYLILDKNNDKFVFRVPGEGGFNFVNYPLEKLNIEIINSLKINSDTIFFDEVNGYKIAKYIEGNTVDNSIDFKKVSTLLKKLHNSNLLMTNDYDHLERLERYEKLHNNCTTEYHNLKSLFIPHYVNKLKHHCTKPCHNDAQIANIILSTNQELFLLDWEFAGNNDYIYDIASFGNKDFKMALDLLKSYHVHVENDLLYRLYMWRTFQCLQWYNVASYKHEIGLGKKLNIEFDKVSNFYIKLAKEMYDNALIYHQT